MVEYADGHLWVYEKQYRTIVSGDFVILEHVDGTVWGLRGIVGWKWEPNKPEPKTQSVADN